MNTLLHRIRQAGAGRRVSVVGPWLVAGLALLVIAGTVVALVDRSPGAERFAAAKRATSAVGDASHGAVGPTTVPRLSAPMRSAPMPAGPVGGPPNAAAAARTETPQASDNAVPAVGDKIVRTGELRVRLGAHRFQSAFDAVATIADRHDGFVASSSTSTGTDGASGDVTIRVPAAEFDAARHDVAGLGKVESQSMNGQDVSGQLVDYDARIRNLQAQEQSLQTIMSKATNIGDVLNVQNELFSVRGQIEELQGQRTRLDDQATFSTLHVTLFEPGAAVTQKPEPKPTTGLSRDVERAWHAGVAVVGGMLIVLGAVAPFAVVGMLGWAVLRFRRRGSAVPTAS